MGESETTARETHQINLRLPTAFGRLWSACSDLECSGRADILRNLICLHARRIVCGAVGRGIINETEVLDSTGGSTNWDDVFDGYTKLIGLIRSRCPDYAIRCWDEAQHLEAAWLSAPKSQEDIDALKTEMKNR